MSEQLNLPYFEQEYARSEISSTTKYGEDIVHLLTDARIEEAAQNGRLTVAMIRPNVGPEANLLGLSDLDCSERIEEMIEGLGIVGKFSIIFSEEIVTEFYSGAPQATMEQAAPLDPNQYKSRWPEFVKFMASGPTTVLLLYSPDGDAISKWREHLGHWNIEKFRDPKTIRGALGVNVFNNLVHGSDSPDSVLRELSLLRRNIDSK